MPVAGCQNHSIPYFKLKTVLIRTCLVAPVLIPEPKEAQAFLFLKTNFGFVIRISFLFGASAAT